MTLLAFLGKVLHHVHELPSAVQKAMAEDGVELLGSIARERVAHLHGLGPARRPGA